MGTRSSLGMDYQTHYSLCNLLTEDESERKVGWKGIEWKSKGKERKTHDRWDRQRRAGGGIDGFGSDADVA